jgi:amidohydrolase
MIKTKLLTAFLVICGTSITAQDLTKTIETKALAVQNKLVEWRRHLHEHPELGNREYNTAVYIVQQLKTLDLIYKPVLVKQEW